MGWNVFPQKAYRSLNQWYLCMWPCLEIGSLQIKLRWKLRWGCAGVRWVLNATWFIFLVKTDRKKGGHNVKTQTQRKDGRLWRLEFCCHKIKNNWGYQEARKGEDESPPQREYGPTRTLILDFYHLELW